MQVEGGLFLDIVIIFAAAFLGGLSARMMRLPILLGYLLAGIVIGPHGLKVIGNLDEVQALAEFGVILLLFAVGIEVSFRELRHLGKSVILIALGQIFVTIGLAFAIGILIGWLPEQAAVFGFVVSLSSTMVVLKTLNDRGELGSLHGRILTGIMLIQDIAFIPMVAILPALGGETDGILLELGLGMGKAAAVLVAIALLGSKVVPWLMNRVANLGSREVFILMLVAAIFVTAAITQAVGLSAALGAFLAGLLLSESEFGHRALSEVIPVRDIFSSMFFVSLGMLIIPAFLAQNYETVLIVVAVTILVKFAVTMGLARASGYLARTSLLSGLGLGQIGEFSFIIAGTAIALGIFDNDFLSLTVASAVLTMAITPGIMAGVPGIIVGLGQRVRFLERFQLEGKSPDGQMQPLNDHAIVCGLGRVGSLVAQALEEHGLPFVAIDLDPHEATQHRSRGGTIIHGSSSSETILEAAHVKHARLMVICTGDPAATYLTAQRALQMNPDLDIVARAFWREEGERLQRLGVREVVWPAMEAGLEMLRHSLMRYRIDTAEVDSLVSRLRGHLSLGAELEPEQILPPEGLSGRPE